MNKKVIIVCGRLASGKSTFAVKLAGELGVPYFVKDTFKSALCRGIAIGDRSISSQFSAVTFNAMLYGAQRLFEAGVPVILEGNFVPAGVKPADEAGELRRLIEGYGYAPLTYRFTGDTDILYRRFIEREQTPERGEANRIGRAVALEDFEGWCRGLDGFDIGGEVIEVDTTDFGQVDTEGLVEAGRRFLGSQQK